MHVFGKSDSLVVPEKRANKAGLPTAAESAEERRLTKENTVQTLLAPDAVPGKRASDCTAYESISSPSKVRAVCGSSARTDLCGGWPERAIPTAIVVLWKRLPSPLNFPAESLWRRECQQMPPIPGSCCQTRCPKSTSSAHRGAEKVGRGKGVRNRLLTVGMVFLRFG
jgi:hypothetical protein